MAGPVRFPTTPSDHLALQAKVDGDLARGQAEGGVLEWMSAQGTSWLETYEVLREENYSDFESEPPANRAAVSDTGPA